MKDKATSKLMGWPLGLLEFEFDNRNRCGVKHQKVNLLSRLVSKGGDEALVND